MSIGTGIAAERFAVFHYRFAQVNNAKAFGTGTLHLRYGRHGNSPELEFQLS